MSDRVLATVTCKLKFDIYRDGRTVIIPNQEVDICEGMDDDPAILLTAGIATISAYELLKYFGADWDEIRIN